MKMKSKNELYCLSMYGFKHQTYLSDLTSRNDCEDIPIEVHCTALILGVWECFRDRFKHPQTLISDYKFNAFEPSFLEPYEEVLPAARKGR